MFCLECGKSRAYLRLEGPYYCGRDFKKIRYSQYYHKPCLDVVIDRVPGNRVGVDSGWSELSLPVSVTNIKTGKSISWEDYMDLYFQFEDDDLGLLKGL